MFLLLALCTLNSLFFARGDVDITSKIVGGYLAKEGDFPYMAMLKQNDKFYCGGSIVHKNYILTASHCLTNHPEKDVTVVLDTIEQDKGGTVYKVEEFIKHPNYTRHPLENDIGLIKLSSEIQFNDNVQIIELNTEDVYDYTEAVVSGWGKRASDKKTSNVLKYVDVAIVSERRCRMLFRKNPSNWVCAGINKGEGFCKGDSGGPLVSENKQIGVVSAFKNPCGARPDMYSRVDKYIDWINTYIN